MIRGARALGEVVLIVLLLVVAAVTSPLWLSWLCFQWWRQLRALERECMTQSGRDAMAYRQERAALRGYTAPRTHALPDDPA